jgi:flagellin-like protein
VIRRNSNHSENQMKGGYNMNNIKNSKRGLSAIVTTLIIILLVFIAIGIVWVVIQDVIKGGTESIDYQSQCLEIGLSVSQAQVLSATTISVAVTRSARGEAIDGVKVTIPQDDGTWSQVVTVPGDIEELVTSSLGILNFAGNTSLVDPTGVTVTPYFVDGVGNEILC